MDSAAGASINLAGDGESNRMSLNVTLSDSPHARARSIISSDIKVSGRNEMKWGDDVTKGHFSPTRQLKLSRESKVQISGEKGSAVKRHLDGFCLDHL